MINATLAVLELPSNQLILKTRERQKGKNQYEKLAQKGEFLLVEEYNAKLWVNLTDYLDTGLFLDHRIARRMLGEMSGGKDFLNLFAYTGTASVHAGLGGARSTTTVDMSRTYGMGGEEPARQRPDRPSASADPGRLPVVAEQRQRTVRRDLHRSADVLQLQADGEHF